MDKHLLLLERTPLVDILQYLEKTCPPHIDVDRESVAREWRRAAERTQELESREADVADNPPMVPLTGAAAEFAESEVQTAAARRALCLAPRRWCVVDTDRLLIYQKAINQTFADQTGEVLEPTSSPEDVVRIALGVHRQPPAVAIRRAGDMTFTFSSASNDIRTLNATVLSPSDVAGSHCSGHPVAALTVFVGLGLNWISALRFRDRLILVNGMHRAYALRSRGIMHVPCLVQDVTSDEELDIFAAGEVRQRINQYARLRRPPLLKDYFDPRLTKQIVAPRSYTMIQVQVSSKCIAAPPPYRSDGREAP